MTAPHTPAGQSDLDDETVRMPQLPGSTTDNEAEFDPDKTVVRDDWESTVIRRVAPRLAAVQSEFAEEGSSDDRFGWESENVRRLAQEVRKNGG